MGSEAGALGLLAALAIFVSTVIVPMIAGPTGELDPPHGLSRASVADARIPGLQIILLIGAIILYAWNGLVLVLRLRAFVLAWGL